MKVYIKIYNQKYNNNILFLKKKIKSFIIYEVERERNNFVNITITTSIPQS